MPSRSNARPEVRIDGQSLAESIIVRLDRVEVEDHGLMPGRAQLRFNALAHDILEDAGVRMGAALEVRVAGVRGDEAVLFEGEVTGLEARYDGTATHAVVRAYDKGHRLHRGRRTEAYRNMSDSQVASRVASRHGLGTAAIETTTPTHEQISQVNQTDWEFLNARAEEVGFEVGVDGRDLVFRKPAQATTGPSAGDLRSGGEGVTLVLGDNLQAFRPRLTSAQQVADVEVRGWDPVAKEAVVGRADTGTVSADVDDSPKKLAEQFGTPRHLQVNRPLGETALANDTAEALSERIGSAFVEAAGRAYGDTRLRAGTAVSIANVAKPFVGRYVLTSTRHVFDRDGYTTHFEITGRHDRSLLGLASLGRSNGSGPGVTRPVHGVVVAQVTDVGDPDERARVKVKFPWLDATFESTWARVPQPGAGKGRGLLVLPEVGDEVLVAFEHGDVRRPFVLGGLYNGRDLPPQAAGAVASDGKVVHRAFTSRSGHRLLLDDTKGAERIVVTDKTGNNEIVIDSKENTVTIRCDGDFTVDAKGNIVLRSGGDVTVEAKGKLQADAGTSLRAEAKTSLDLKAGTSGSFEAGTSLDLKGSVSATVKAPSAELSGDASVSVKGAIVRIN